MTAMRMMMGFVALGALGACTAGAQIGGIGAQGRVGSVGPAAAAAAPMAPADRLVAAIEAQGCVITSDNVAQVLLKANLTQQQLLEIAPQLSAQGRAEVSDGGTIRVLTENCI
ncbi:hypothetical protein CLV79_113108 [Limimaricola soesokkakensis]|uniref:NADH dehydrogenase subunit E n=1 Tax=Limimaricola soesokkakensis TaxID=1343159 RepID=A0A1X6YGB7_9RHOB|nr:MULTISPECIES: hypothetical protein [Limimaricola]MCZ4261921.1 hypothetical protein [Limimaricola sp. G21655-S1]PSK82224.1 hypothetical protein CLV79_113108 [Limimaricola soesokkakensis]SLN18591.1 hypothetical protein LOS8367_00424 [Limimaricola soesokkakensis]